MKTPHLATAMLAASMMGGSAVPIEYTLNPLSNLHPLFVVSGPPRRNLKGRVAQNQKQSRKDRRRAHAAGCKTAFA